ncbi:MAG: helix-turn-helix domain-containing protein [Bacteroidota bacterium]
MKDRIQQIIDYKGISAGDLAELLDVQRSNISHILNGRNKPGAVFIEKFLQTFPDVNARWLLTGEGPMLFHDEAKEPSKGVSKPADTTTEEELNPPVRIPEQSPASGEKDKTIEKIVLLYSDGTFSYYHSK